MYLLLIWYESKHQQGFSWSMIQYQYNVILHTDLQWLRQKKVKFMYHKRPPVTCMWGQVTGCLLCRFGRNFFIIMQSILFWFTIFLVWLFQYSIIQSEDNFRGWDQRCSLLLSIQQINAIVCCSVVDNSCHLAPAFCQEMVPISNSGLGQPWNWCYVWNICQGVILMS